MESNWRRNIHELGFAAAGWTLCARILEPGYPEGFWLVEWPDYQAVLVGTPYISGDGSLSFPAEVYPRVGTFPHGVRVEPD